MNKIITIILIFIVHTSCGTDTGTYFENATVQVQDSCLRLSKGVLRAKLEKKSEYETVNLFLKKTLNF